MLHLADKRPDYDPFYGIPSIVFLYEESERRYNSFSLNTTTGDVPCIYPWKSKNLSGCWREVKSGAISTCTGNEQTNRIAAGGNSRAFSSSAVSFPPLSLKHITRQIEIWEPDMIPIIVSDGQYQQIALRSPEVLNRILCFGCCIDKMVGFGLGSHTGRQCRSDEMHGVAKSQILFHHPAFNTKDAYMRPSAFLFQYIHRRTVVVLTKEFGVPGRFGAQMQTVCWIGVVDHSPMACIQQGNGVFVGVRKAKPVNRRYVVPWVIAIAVVVMSRQLIDYPVFSLLPVFRFFRRAERRAGKRKGGKPKEIFGFFFKTANSVNLCRLAGREQKAVSRVQAGKGGND